MSAAVVIIDTSIFVEILDLPGLAAAAADKQAELEAWILANAALLLPIAVIIETGNHIAKLSNGNQRRAAARRFVDMVRQALEGNSPFAPTPSFAVEVLREWLPEFIGHATRAVGMADASLIELWKHQRTLNPARRVLIWSLDSDLVGYDTGG